MADPARSEITEQLLVAETAERRRAEEALNRYADRLQHLRLIDRAILTGRSLGEIAQSALVNIRHLIPTTRVALVMIDQAAARMTLLAFSTHDTIHATPGQSAPLAVIGEMLDPLAQGQIYHVLDIAALPDPPQLLSAVGAEHLRGFFMVPILADGELVGALNVGSDLPNAFSDEHLDIAREVADQLSIAIQQARLREQLESHAQDLEQRVLARTAEIDAANKELEAFSYSVSHDLRAPLRVIDGFSRILLQDYAAILPEEAQHYFRRVRANVQQMGHLIDDLLSFSRLSRQPLSRRPIAHAELVRQCVEDLRAEQQGREIAIHIGDLPDCVADPALLRQVWINLISNAIKYTRSRARAQIEIGSRAEGAATIYFISDNGVGFDMRYSDKLFGVFQRMHRDEDYEGTGVGLAIVQRVISRHNGQIWAEAVVDQGATFSFTFGAA